MTMTSSNLPSSIPVFRRVLVWSCLVAAAVAVVGGGTGLLVGGMPGLWSAIAAAIMTLVFTGFTVVSLILAVRLNPMFFVMILLVAWALKFIVFLGVIIAIKDAPWVHPVMLFACLVAAVVGTLVVDVVVVLKARMSYASEVRLPGQ